MASIDKSSPVTDHFPPRPHVIAWFLEPDDEHVPLLTALGRAIVGAAVLEKFLLLELVRLRGENEGLTEELAADVEGLERLTAGGLLKQLRKLGLPSDLDVRIADAIDRRNQLVHHLMEDAEIVKAIQDDDGLDNAVRRVEQLALDCGRLGVELMAVAVPRLEALLGMSLAQIRTILRSIDVNTIEDPLMRQQLEAVQAISDLDLSDLPLPS
ncbi:MAG: hypothetical protein ACYCU0_02365 [Solirubrobacteraceae bacterium]